MTKFTPYIGKINAYIMSLYILYIVKYFFFENIGKKSSFRHKPRFYKGFTPIISSFFRQISSLNP